MEFSFEASSLERNAREFLAEVQLTLSNVMRLDFEGQKVEGEAGGK